MASASPPAPLPPLESFIEVLPVPPQQERRRGIVRFVGLTDFAEGEWVGVELVGSEGRNDGSVKGQVYFRCLPGQGVFVRPNLIVPFGAAAAQEQAEAVAAVASQPLLTTIAELTGQLRKAEEELAVARDATAQRAVMKDSKDDDDDDDLAEQVRMEEQRLELRRLLDASEARLRGAEEDKRSLQAALTAAEEREKAAHSAVQHAEEALVQLQRRVEALQTELAHAVAQGMERQKAVETHNTAPDTEREALLAELHAARRELQHRHTQVDELTVAQASLNRQLSAQAESATAAERRAGVAEERLAELRTQSTAAVVAAREDASAAHSTLLTQLRRDMTALQAEKAAMEHTHASQLRSLEERLAAEAVAAVAAQKAADAAQLSALERDKAELQELCQLLEDELKEERHQSDELAHVVEQLGAEKAAVEAALDAAQQPIAQERDRLRRELEEGRAREVRLMTAAEAAQQEKDAALQRAAECSQQLADASSQSASLTALSGAAAGPRPPLSASPSAHTHDAQPPALAADSLAEALQRTRDELDEAQQRILRLSGTEQVAHELQRRCDELTQRLEQQRVAAQKQQAALQHRLDAAETKSVEEVALWKRQCMATQRSNAELNATIAALQQQQQQQQAGRGAPESASKKANAPAPGQGLDAAREMRYERRIAALTQQLMASQSSRAGALAAVSTQHGVSTATSGGQCGELRSPAKLLDFSSPAACKASTQALFETH